MSESPSKSPQRRKRTTEQNINTMGYPPHYTGSDTPSSKFAPPSTQAPINKKNFVKPLPRSEIEAAFQFFDVHNRKRLTPSDLKERLSPFYPHLANKEYKFLVSEGDFTVDTLVGILNHQVLRDFDPVKESFKVFDPHDTGYIDKNVLKKILKGLGYGNITNEDMKILIQTADVDGDGRISYEDWKNMTGYDMNKGKGNKSESKNTSEIKPSETIDQAENNDQKQQEEENDLEEENELEEDEEYDEDE